MKHINSYKSYNEDNESEILYKLFEKREISTWQKEQKNVIKEIGLNYYFIATFGTSVTAFYPFIESIIKNTGYELRVFDIILLTITALAILLKENKNSIHKAKLIINEKGLDELLKMIIDVIKNVKKLFSILASNFGKVIKGIRDLFIYSILLVPFISVLVDVNINDINLVEFLKSVTLTGVGATLVGLKYYGTDIFNKIKNKFDNLIMKIFRNNEEFHVEFLYERFVYSSNKVTKLEFAILYKLYIKPRKISFLKNDLYLHKLDFKELVNNIIELYHRGLIDQNDNKLFSLTNSGSKLVTKLISKFNG